ncbi:MAG: hypothetical protein R3178_00005, partial [Rhodothermales bacterium]|nr:hypothetical protein [Rhodothermales bacterium]
SVKIAVHDVIGRQVAVLHDGPLSARVHHYQVDTSDWSSGVYLVSVLGQDGAGRSSLIAIR